ncbi:MAG: allantoate amidohydrolase [Terracidiphilus sp.]
MSEPVLLERARRAIAECRRIAAMTEEPGRTTRRFLTPPVHHVHELLRRRMESLGMTVTLDAAGNLRGLTQPSKAHAKRLVLGSHIDTVPNAGAFDGILGVALALELVELAQNLKLPMELIAFSDEEGVRYAPFLGSRAVAGRFDAPTLLSLRDREGVTMEQAIRAFGLDPGRIGDAAIGDRALGFFEIHIEQGPVLEAEGLSVAAVTSIAGQSRFAVKFVGHANHAGTTPMHLRRDALAGAAEWIVDVEAYAKQTEGLVATVGKLGLEPNAGNVIPGSVTLGFEVRHVNDPVRKEAAEALLERAKAIAVRRHLALDSESRMDQPAVPMDEQLTALLVEAIEALGLPPRRMPSGAGHDAMVMAQRVPAAMLFLRSLGGISHHPDENVREEDVETALRAGLKFVERLAAEIR